MSQNAFETVYNSLNSVLNTLSISNFEDLEFETFCVGKAHEIYRNYPAGRSYAEILTNTRNGFLNEYVLCRAINGTMNPNEFNSLVPDSFCWDISHNVLGKIEVKSWNPNSSKWLNFNLNNSYRFDDPLLTGVGHFDTLVKHADRITLVVTMYREGNNLRVSGVFSPQAFKLYSGKTYGNYVRESRVLPSGQKTSHYLDLRKVKSDNLGYFK